MDLKYTNCPKLPIVNTPLCYQFMTLDHFKLPFHCDLTLPLDVGNKMNRKCCMWFTHAYIWLEMFKLPWFKWNETIRERERGLRSGWLPFDVAKHPLKAKRVVNHPLKAFGVGDNPLKVKGVGDHPLKAFRDGQNRAEGWFDHPKKPIGEATLVLGVVACPSIRPYPEYLREWSTTGWPVHRLFWVWSTL